MSYIIRRRSSGRYLCRCVDVANARQPIVMEFYLPHPPGYELLTCATRSEDFHTPSEDHTRDLYVLEPVNIKVQAAYRGSRLPRWLAAGGVWVSDIERAATFACMNEAIAATSLHGGRVHTSTIRS